MIILELNTLEHHKYFYQVHMIHILKQHFLKHFLLETGFEKHLQDPVFFFYLDPHQLEEILHKI